MTMFHPRMHPAALEHLQRTCADLDVKRASAAELEAPLRTAMKGTYDPSNDAHKALALGLAAWMGIKLQEALGAFWFPNREAPWGWAVGLPQAVVAVSPWELVQDALRQGKLRVLDERCAELLGSVQRVGAKTDDHGPRLDAESYRKLFDPGFVRFVRLEAAAIPTVLTSTPPALAKLPSKTVMSVEEWYRSLPSDAPMSTHVMHAPGRVEQAVMMLGAVGTTGPAAEEFWADVVLRLLRWRPASGADAGDTTLESVVASIGPPQEPRLLGWFAPETVKPCVEKATPARLLSVDPADLRTTFASLGPDELRAQLAPRLQSRDMFELALSRLAELKALVTALSKDELLCLQRMTESDLKERTHA